MLPALECMCENSTTRRNAKLGETGSTQEFPILAVQNISSSDNIMGPKTSAWQPYLLSSFSLRKKCRLGRGELGFETQAFRCDTAASFEWPRDINISTSGENYSYLSFPLFQSSRRQTNLANRTSLLLPRALLWANKSKSPCFVVFPL